MSVSSVGSPTNIGGAKLNQALVMERENLAGDVKGKDANGAAARILHSSALI
jgi:hypothetical protein